LAIASVILFVACQGEGSPPVFQSLPTPTTPPGFVTFSDESNLFRIEYPPEWELALSLLPDLEETLNEFIMSKESNLPVGNVATVFLAGLPVEDGYLPNVNITLESLPSEMSLQQYFEASEKNLKEFSSGYEVHQHASLLIGDMLSMKSDYEYDLSTYVPGASGKLRVILLIMVDGKVGWSVSCTLEPQAVEEDLETCDAVVRSFRLLR
jgi:hypothetical protein